MMVFCPIVKTLPGACSGDGETVLGAMEQDVDGLACASANPRAENLGHGGAALPRSEEHTSELQSLTNLVCRLLLEKKKKKKAKEKHHERTTKKRPINMT